MNVPTVLRKVDGDGRYQFLGEMFVLGMMHGECHEGAVKTGGLHEQKIVLV